MKFFSAQTGSDWVEASDKKDEEKEALQRIKFFLSETLKCENLIVLTGLGTSLCVQNQDSERLAPTMWNLWEQMQRDSGDYLEEVLKLVNYPEEYPENIELLLSLCKQAQTFFQDGVKEKLDQFVATTEKMIHEKTSFVTPSTALPIHEDFLRRVARRSNRKVRTKVFTTNYDKCFELAGSAGRFVVIDGFSHMLPQTFDASYFGYDIVQRDEHTDSPDYISNVFHLYKMHGSVDWNRNPDTKEISKSEASEHPVLIYPRHTKYELAFEQPYLEMMAAFQSAIRKPNTGLIVVGFGFNDNHISEPILSAMRSNLNLKVAICDPALAPSRAEKEGDEDKEGIASQNQYLKKVKALIENGDPRLALLNGTFEDLVSAMPDIIAETALEKHLERVKRMEETA